MSRRLPVSKSAARYILAEIERRKTACLAEITARRLELPQYERETRAADSALHELIGILSYYADPR